MKGTRNLLLIMLYGPYSDIVYIFLSYLILIHIPAFNLALTAPKAVPSAVSTSSKLSPPLLLHIPPSQPAMRSSSNGAQKSPTTSATSTPQPTTRTFPSNSLQVGSHALLHSRLVIGHWSPSRIRRWSCVCSIKPYGRL